MSRVLLQVSVTENDFLTFKETILFSLSVFVKNSLHDTSIFIVYQTASSDIPSDDFFERPDVLFNVTHSFGVSLARNSALAYARENKFDYVVFHDSSSVVTKSFVDLVNSTVSLGLDVSKGVVRFTDKVKVTDVGRGDIVARRVNPIYDSYICLYVFKIDFLGGRNFNELLGPGINTVLNAGEDFIFVHQLFSEKKIKRVNSCNVAWINHPVRPSDNSKQLLYAESQGVILRWLCGWENISFSVFFYFFAFFGNAILNVLIFKRKSPEILLCRVKGFLDFSGKRKIIDV